eukprot:989345_1
MTIICEFHCVLEFIRQNVACKLLDKSHSLSNPPSMYPVSRLSPLNRHCLKPLQQKQEAELKELGAQTLDILNQLQEKTRMLLDDTHGLSERSTKRLGHTKKSLKKKTKRKTKFKIKGTINGSNIAMNTSLIEIKTETKTKTKIKVKTEDKSSWDIMKETTQEGQKNVHGLIFEVKERKNSWQDPFPLKRMKWNSIQMKRMKGRNRSFANPFRQSQHNQQRQKNQNSTQK